MKVIVLKMKTYLFFLKIKNKILKMLIKIKNLFLNISLLSKNMYFVFCTSKSEVKAFGGFGYRWLAVKYADKRSEISRVNKVCGGKRHYVIDYDKNILMVINKTERNLLRSKGIIKDNYNILQLFENAYYITK
jgi:hypothetical protein